MRIFALAFFQMYVPPFIGSSSVFCRDNFVAAFLWTNNFGYALWYLIVMFVSISQWKLDKLDDGPYP